MHIDSYHLLHTMNLVLGIPLEMISLSQILIGIRASRIICASIREYCMEFMPILEVH